MVQIKVSVPEPMKDWCEAQVESGRSSTVSGYVRDLIRRDQSARQSDVQTMIEDALASGVSPHSLDEVFAKAKEENCGVSSNNPTFEGIVRMLELTRAQG